MECSEHIKTLLPDYHLGHLPPEEAEMVSLHLAEHAECREELEEVARVLDLVPFSVQPAVLPPALKNRTLSRALAQESPPAGVRELPSREGGGARRGVNTVLLGAAAVVLVALLGLGWTYLSLQRENERLQAEVSQLQEDVRGQSDLLVVAVDGTGRAPEARGTAVVDPVEGALALDVYNLPAPPQGHSYRAWLVEAGGGEVALGPMETNERGDGRMTGSIPEPVTGYDLVQITTEPLGGEERSGPVYMEAKL
jgi:anti-sigma factor RsiW